MPTTCRHALYASEFPYPHWNACALPVVPGRYVCPLHAAEADAQLERVIARFAEDGEDLLYSLGAP